MMTITRENFQILAHIGKSGEGDIRLECSIAASLVCDAEWTRKERVRNGQPWNGSAS